MPRVHVNFVFAILAAGLACHAVHSADAPACTGFKWDVAHEVALMRGAAHTVLAAHHPGGSVPEVKPDTLYSLKLTDQARVRFAATPGKSGAAAGAQAGLVQFRLEHAGRYRISIASGHWIDVVNDGQLVPAVDFQGHAGCERPRKIVEFGLPADRALILQFSGSADQDVAVTITAAKAAS